VDSTLGLSPGVSDSTNKLGTTDFALSRLVSDSDKEAEYPLYNEAEYPLYNEAEYPLYNEAEYPLYNEAEYPLYSLSHLISIKRHCRRRPRICDLSFG